MHRESQRGAHPILSPAFVQVRELQTQRKELADKLSQLRLEADSYKFEKETLASELQVSRKMSNVSNACSRAICVLNINFWAGCATCGANAHLRKNVRYITDIHMMCKGRATR